MLGFLAPLAGLLGIETDALLQRAKESAVAIAAIGLFLLIGITFLLVALYTWLAAWLGPIWSPVIIAAAAFVIALVLFIALKIQSAAVRRREEIRRRETETTALIASAALGALPDLLNSSLLRNVGLPVALYVGFLLFTGRHHGASSESAPPPHD